MDDKNKLQEINELKEEQKIDDKIKYLDTNNNNNDNTINIYNYIYINV